MFDKILSSFGRVQFFLLCLQLSHFASSTQVYSFDDLFHGKITGSNESNQYSMTDSFLLEVNKSVTFWLYTKEHPESSLRLVPGDPKSLSSAGFDGSKPTKIVIHGWLGNSESDQSICLALKTEYFALYDYNVVCVDWSVIALDLPYFTARLRCKEIGNYIGEMITTITENTSQSNDDIHIIGFSMGAHIAGYAGKHLGGKVHRITGLDPARPLFLSKRSAERLNNTDAQFVDVVHTTNLVLGQHKPIGNIDFYPNGGISNQPGCRYDYVYGEVCSHFKSYEFYARSIRSRDEFKSIKCDKWKDYEQSKCEDPKNYTYLGEYADPSFSGTYYLTVN
ncbi:pancreatic triacylglycerol lipase-like isoform X1 [Rhopalosiphum padi]|uniref:pancreatic triacylglycerol lipase-like isoform X1 n=1 Tax=Rhopalosiphum padi TaxID=40932 RepID=UPI00298E0589|nr:pancreatic triacylglycerol lipase-like isoform X1 [Rhopalosiphum padi]